MKRKPNWQILWNAMENGIEIELHGLTYTIVDGKLCARLHVYHNGGGLNKKEPDETRYLVSDISLNDFIEECDKIPEEKIVGYAASSVLTKINREGGVRG
jgi:hypothetical protein